MIYLPLAYTHISKKNTQDKKYFRKVSYDGHTKALRTPETHTGRLVTPRIDLLVSLLTKIPQAFKDKINFIFKTFMNFKTPFMIRPRSNHYFEVM